MKKRSILKLFCVMMLTMCLFGVTALADDDTSADSTEQSEDITDTENSDSDTETEETTSDPVSLTEASITLSSTSFTYDGTAQEPSVEEVTITIDETEVTLTEGTDYTVSYSDNTEAGTATVEITGDGTNYTGAASTTFTIEPKSLSASDAAATLTLSATSYTYNGATRTPSVKSVKLTLNGSTVTLTSGTDYTITSNSGRKNVGTGTVKVTGTGNYTGTIKATYEIKAKSLSAATVTLSSSSYTYNGKTRTPSVKSVKLTLNGSTVTLTKGTDYTITSNNGRKNVGTGTVKITGTGNYTGTVKATYKVNPKSATDITYTAASKGIKAEWSAVSAQATGYQIQCATNKTFTSGKKTVTVTGRTTETGGISGLTGKKTYYVRMRTYKTVDGTKYYSSWSTVKKVKTLKKVTVFAGDSIMTGMMKSSYNGISYVDISGTEKVIAKKSLNPYTFQTVIYSGEDTYLDKALSYMPYRIYIMLGTNGIEYLSVSYLIENFEELIECIQEESPTTDIVILSVPPVSKSVASSRTGFKKISSLNSKLKSMAKEYGIHYYDFTSTFKTSSGYLKSTYNGGDGIHWNLKGYKKFAALITKYDAKLED